MPKGPSLDPGQRRLAVAVEYYLLEYGCFEGIIPKGQYGGGTVMVRDEGEWEPVEDDAAHGLRQGKLKFLLKGTKLQGGWSLIRLAEEPNWLLIKEKDHFADPDSEVTELDKSVVSGRSLDEIATVPARRLEQPHGRAGCVRGESGPKRQNAGALPSAVGHLAQRATRRRRVAARDQV